MVRVRFCKSNREGVRAPNLPAAPGADLLGKAAFEALEAKNEVGLRDSVPARLGSPHRGHGPEGKLKRLVDLESLQRRVGPELAITADESDARVFDRYRVPPIPGSRRHE